MSKQPGKREAEEKLKRNCRYNDENEYLVDDSAHDGRRRALRDRKTQTVRDLGILVFFIVVSAVAVLLVKAMVDQEKETTAAGESLIETTFRPEETAEEETTEEETTEPETEPATEPTTEPTTEPSTEPSTEPETEPLSTERPFPPYAAPVPGLTIPVQNGITMPSWVTQQIISTTSPGRPTTPLSKSAVKHVVVHYVGNTLSTAKDNRDYFEYLTDGRTVSSHFVVGLYGEIIQCIPLSEVAYAQGGYHAVSGNVNHNEDSISIETCHYNDAGQFTNETYWALVKLTAWLLQAYGLPANTDTIWMHKTVSGKSCPKYWADHPEEYTRFVETVGRYMNEHPSIASEMP